MSIPTKPPIPDLVAQSPASRWAYRFALATALTSIPLFIFGGSVTTLGAGMAVEGWLDAEGDFMLFFPVEKWFRNRATIVEHTHRLFGALVGMFAIATLVAGWMSKRKAWPLAGLIAVCAQGTLGGFRVLENSPQLAFLHGALAQAVLALLCAVTLALSPWWIRTKQEVASNITATGRSPLARTAWQAVLIIYIQVVIGAWYRHGLRTDESGIALRLALHFVGAFLVFLAVLAVAKRVRRSCAEWQGEQDIEPVRRAGKRLVHLLAIQVLLGLFAWASHTGGEVSIIEWALSVLHVLTGGLLLAQCTVLALSTFPFGASASSAETESAVGVTA
ncbi:MAG: cytochrome c oxidase assembly protein subunit 15 [Planctomycetota bacterium]